jgi:hypothetical protein
MGSQVYLMAQYINMSVLIIHYNLVLFKGVAPPDPGATVVQQCRLRKRTLLGKMSKGQQFDD